MSKKIRPVVKKVKTHPGTRETAVVAQPFISYILGKSEFSDSKPVGSNKEKQKQDKKQTTPEIRSIASATPPKGY